MFKIAQPITICFRSCFNFFKWQYYDQSSKSKTFKKVPYFSPFSIGNQCYVYISFRYTLNT